MNGQTAWAAKIYCTYRKEDSKYQGYCVLLTFVCLFKKSEDYPRHYSGLTPSPSAIKLSMPVQINSGSHCSLFSKALASARATCSKLNTNLVAPPSS